MMKCVKCGGKTTVWDSRARTDYVFRRRRCLACTATFETHEVPATAEERDLLRRSRQENAKLTERISHLENIIRKLGD